MIQHIADTTVLNNGVRMPWLGLGVWKTNEGEEVVNAVKDAVKAGYRSIDTAAIYGNEVGVGKGIRECGIARDQLFITTKVWNAAQGYESTLQAYDESRIKLGLEYLDLYLVHWAVQGKYKDTWKALEKLYKDGLVRAIGVSNFQVHHLQEIMAGGEFKPAVNQVEYHPQLQQNVLHAFCKANGIQLEAWSPLMQGKLLDHPTIVELGIKYKKTPAQIILRWDLQNEIVTIPKSVNADRIGENANIFNFELSADDMSELAKLNQDQRVGPDPDNVNF